MLKLMECNGSTILHDKSATDSSRDLTEGGDSESTMATEVLYAVIGVLVAIILINVAVLICWKFRKSRNRMTGYHGGPKPSWEIAAKDLSLYEYNEQDSRKLSADCASLYSQTPLAFGTDNEKLDAANKETTTDFGYFKEQPVCMKKLTIENFQPTSQQQKDLDIMVAAHHENVATFYGACMKPSHTMLVTQYCIKGSLKEIFLFEPVHIDEAFIASIVMDIVRGMMYLQKTSALGLHGNLKSSNCLVTGRWVVKLSGFGLTQLRTKYREEKEIIQGKQLCSQKSDIYSFGIILYEVIGKQGPFGKGYSYMDEELQELVQRICTCNYHPETSWLCCEDYLKNIMLSCWQTHSKRPDFHALITKLKPFRATLNGRSIVDNMLVIMERYQMRLEDLVEEKTSQLQLEQRKTENLLHRMLPPQIAGQLIAGRKVLPERYSCITALFSNLCGFTAMASSTTPLEVIRLLSSLYTMFDSIIENYDVYKVETAGEAYLCVSGLSRPNGDKHAVEIASMAVQFIKSLKTFKDRQSTSTKLDLQLQMRVGIHSGPCVAGVVGGIMPRYTLFGETINGASTMETTSQPMKIQISQQTKNLLEKQPGSGFTFEKRGAVDMKGSGDMVTWWLVEADDNLYKQPTNYLYQPNTVTDSLQLPGAGADIVCSSPAINELDLLTVSQLTRSRSNSVRSQNSSSRSCKSVQTFHRAGSFRQKIKQDSLSSPHVSEDNIAKVSATTSSFLTLNDENSRLLGCRSRSPKQSFTQIKPPSIVIQVDEAY